MFGYMHVKVDWTVIIFAKITSGDKCYKSYPQLRINYRGKINDTAYQNQF